MTFNTSKNKLKKIYNDSNKNQFQIDTLSDNDKKISLKTNQVNRKSNNFTNIIDYSSDWLTPETRTREKDGENIIWRFFKEYIVEINGINKNFNPIFESKVSYRLGDSEKSAPIPDALYHPPGTPFDDDVVLELNSITEIKPSGDEDNLLNDIKFITSFSLYEWDGLPGMLQIKFFVTLSNPLLSVSS